MVGKTKNHFHKKLTIDVCFIKVEHIHPLIQQFDEFLTIEFSSINDELIVQKKADIELMPFEPPESNKEEKSHLNIFTSKLELSNTY